MLQLIARVRESILQVTKLSILGKSQPILIVEDSDDDYESTVRALTRSGNLSNPLVRCKGGQEAIDWLRDGSASSAGARPGLILLDLNMPGLDGRSVLKVIKNDPELRDIPVVVLTTSKDDKDIEACYQEGANTYIQKPVDLDGFFTAIQRLKEYWFEIAILPKS